MAANLAAIFGDELESVKAAWDATEAADDYAPSPRDENEAVAGASRTLTVALNFMRKGSTDGDPHRQLFDAAANLGEFDCVTSLAHALLSEAGLESGLPLHEVQLQIERGLNHGRVRESGEQG